jgi:hypothetical protein
MYSEKNISLLASEYEGVTKTYEDTLLRLSFINLTLSNDEAKENLMQGAGRRLRIINASIHNIFGLFPPTHKEVLSDDEAAALCIQMHAFIINTAGIADNLAWTLVKEKNVSLKPTEVGLHLAKTKDILSAAFRQYLETDPISTWSKRYLKEYRDALAHRIPLYIPPGESPDGKRFPVPIFRGSVNSDHVVKLHPQVLADFNTVAQIVEKFTEFEFPAAATLERTVALM